MTRHELNLIIGANLRRLKDKKGWTNKILSAAVGINVDVVSCHLTGRRGASLEALLKYCNVFDVAPVELFR